MDRFITLYLIDAKKDIETRNKTSDNRAYNIRTEKLETINFLLSKQKIAETEKAEAAKILGVKLA